ncbi:hypothetical protein ScPMuIL_014112 [Solemya velum]
MAADKPRGCFISSGRAILMTLLVCVVIIAVALIVFFSTTSAQNGLDHGKGDYSGSLVHTTDSCQYDPIVPAQWLHRKLGQIRDADNDDCMRILDAGTYMDGHDLYLKGHIPNALFYNTSQCLFDPQGRVGDLPDEECFQEYIRLLGISRNTHVVVYDRYLNIVASRIWWTLRLFGHNKVSIVDGGMSAWTRLGYNTSLYSPRVKKTEFRIKHNPSLLVDFDDMTAIVKEKTAQVVDSRDPKEFTGETTTPGYKTGHMPGAINVPLKEVLDTDDTIKPPGELKQIFADRGVDLTQPIVSTCRTGVYSTTLTAIFFSLGVDNVASYDGSWQDWSRRATDDMITTG